MNESIFCFQNVKLFQPLSKSGSHGPALKFLGKADWVQLPSFSPANPIIDPVIGPALDTDVAVDGQIIKASRNPKNNDNLEKVLYQMREKERYKKKKNALLYSMNEINAGNSEAKYAKLSQSFKNDKAASNAHDNSSKEGGIVRSAGSALSELKRSLYDQHLAAAGISGDRGVVGEDGVMADIGVVRTIKDQQVNILCLKVPCKAVD